MLAVKGIYQGGDTVKLDPFSTKFSEPYEVIVTFLTPVQRKEKTDEDSQRRKEAFDILMSFQGTLPANFDYKKRIKR